MQKIAANVSSLIPFTSPFYSPLPLSNCMSERLIVTPSMLHPKSFTKTRHEHHIYVLVHVMECIDEALQLKQSIKVFNKKLLHNSYS